MSIIRYKNVEWTVPFLFNNQTFLINVQDKLSEVDVESPIKYAYGFIHNRWNGFEYGMDRIRDLGNLLKNLIYYNVTPIINFSNYHLQEEDLKDGYCNELLNYGVENNVWFYISSDLLYNYIKNKYPHAKLVSSEIKALYEMEKGSEVEFYKQLYDKYEMITLSPHYVKDGFVNDYEKFEDVSKFEVIVNNTCLVNCDKFKEHNETVENFEMGRGEDTDFYRICPKHNIDLLNGIGNTLVLSKKELDNIVNNLNIKHLRLNGYYMQPALFPEVLSNYIFETYGNFQHFSFMVDESMINPKLK